MPLGGLTMEFVKEELKSNLLGCELEVDQDFVDKLNLLSQSLPLETYVLITRIMMYAWYVDTEKVNVDFLNAFEQAYKNNEAIVWAKCWLDFCRQEDEEAMFDIANDAEEQPPALDYYGAAAEDANRVFTLEFVEENLSDFGCKSKVDQDFVDKLNLLSQSLPLESDDLITRTMMYAWYVEAEKLNVDFLDAFEQAYKNNESIVWAKCWLNFCRQEDEEAMIDIADDTEEQPPAMDNAAAVEDANRAMREEEIDQPRDEEAMFDIADDAEEQPPAMDYAAELEDANRANRFVRPANIIFNDGEGMVEVYYDDDEGLVEEHVIALDEHEDRLEMSTRARPTEEQIAQAQTLREQDQSDPAPTRFTRACLVCATKNPRKRAVFTPCGHIVCYPCAVENARSDATDGHCVFCRSTGGFVMLFEEYGSDDVNEGN